MFILFKTKKLKMKNIFPLLLLIAVFGCNSKSGPAIDLKLNLQKGDSFTMITQAVTSQNPSISYTQFTETKYVVDSVMNDAYHLKVYLVRTKSEITQDGKVDGYDSQKDESTMTQDELLIHNQFKEVLSHPVNMTMTKNAMINGPITYDNGNEITDGILDVKNITLNYPSTPVRVGDAWEKEQVDKLTQVKVTDKFTVTKITDNEVTLAVKMNMKGAGGMLDNEGDGDYTIDRKTGKIISGEIDLKMQANGNLKITISQK